MWNKIVKGGLFNSPIYVVTLLVFLTAFQLWALVLQFEGGFRPFQHEPTRVPFSWDMFATLTERCLMEWDPPLQMTPIGVLTGLQQLGHWLEWDVIYDSLQGYVEAGQIGCSFEEGGGVNKTRVKLRCFRPDGNEIHREFYCL